MLLRTTLSILLTKCSFRNELRRTISKIKLDACPKPLPPMNLTIIGANTKVGQISALLLKQIKLFENIILYDKCDTSNIVSDLIDLNTSPNVVGFSGAKQLRDAIQHARIVFICTGLQTYPDMSERQMFEKHVFDVRQAVLYCTEFNHRAMIVIASSPVPSLVPMAIEEFRKADFAADKQIFGMATIHTCRSNALTGMQVNVNPAKLNCYVIGGNHRRTIIPVLSPYTIKRALNENLTKNIQEAEEDVLHEKRNEKDGNGCYLSTAYASVKFLISLARALNGEKNIVECAYVKQQSPMDEYSRYFTAPIELGSDGVKKCHIPKLSEMEKTRLKIVTEHIQDNIFIGENYSTGINKITAVHRPKKQPKPGDKFCKKQKVKVACTKDKKRKEKLCEKRYEPKQIIIPN